MTPARRALYEALQTNGALTMKQLCQLLPCDRASVYRTVALFEKLGVVQRVYTGWKYSVELSDVFDHHHHHATCLQCYKVLVLPEDATLEAVLHTIASKQGFQLESHQVELNGVCQACRK